MLEDTIRYELVDDVAILRWDDGGANVVSPSVLELFGQLLDRAEEEARAVTLFGRPGRFCAGFDLSVIQGGGRPMVEMVLGGARLALRLYGLSKPVIIGCTGHAVAMGSILLMGADARVGTAGKFKIGLNEVAIGMVLPPFGIHFAEERLAATHLQRAVIGAELFDPAGAQAAGFLDHVVEADELERATLDEAARWARLDIAAHAGTKQRMRGPFIEKVTATLSQQL